MGVAGDG